MDISAYTLIVFTFFGSLRIVSYIPQILRIAADKNGAAVISYTTWDCGPARTPPLPSTLQSISMTRTWQS
jgi:hypothetical protein